MRSRHQARHRWSIVIFFALTLVAPLPPGAGLLRTPRSEQARAFSPIALDPDTGCHGAGATPTRPAVVGAVATQTNGAPLLAHQGSHSISMLILEGSHVL